MTMRNTWRLLVCSECGELDEDQQECGFCGSNDGVTMIDVVPADSLSLPSSNVTKEA